MSLEKVQQYFSGLGIADRIIVLEQSSATVALAAQALNTEEARIAKTLSFMVAGSPVLIVTAGDTKIDNAKYKGKFGVKAKMLTSEELESLVGHLPGGVCPFGIKENVKVYLDESLKRFQTVFPACGSENSAIEFTIPEIEKYSNFIEWVDVSKPREC